MFDKFIIAKYYSEYQFHALNAGIAVVVAIAGYALLKGLLKFICRKLGDSSDKRASKAWPGQEGMDASGFSGRAAGDCDFKAVTA